MLNSYLRYYVMIWKEKYANFGMNNVLGIDLKLKSLSK